MYFNNCATIEELKKEYRKLSKENHPDLGGDIETMKAINVAYQEAFNRLSYAGGNAARGMNTNEHAADFINVINSLVTLGDNITIEICGSWIWVSGDTYPVRDKIKAAGCRWAGKKKMWYWHSAQDAPRKSRGMAMDEIRNLYGSTVVTGDGGVRAALGA